MHDLKSLDSCLLCQTKLNAVYDGEWHLECPNHLDNEVWGTTKFWCWAKEKDNINAINIVILDKQITLHLAFNETIIASLNRERYKNTFSYTKEILRFNHIVNFPPSEDGFKNKLNMLLLFS